MYAYHVEREVDRVVVEVVPVVAADVSQSVGAHIHIVEEHILSNISRVHTSCPAVMPV